MAAHHAPFSPSKLPRLLACPFSANFEHKESDRPSSTYAQRGIDLHKLLADYILSRTPLPSTLPNEDKEAVQYCIQYLNSLPRPASSLVEYPVHLNDLCYGTVDYVHILPDHAYVIDWKFGIGIKVNINEQLFAYALAVLPHIPHVRSLTLQIVQPAFDHCPSQRITLTDLLQYKQRVLDPFFRRIQSTDPSEWPINPSPSTCRFCKGKMECPSYKKTADKLAKKVFAQFRQPVISFDNWTQEEIETYLDHRSFFNEFFKELHNFYLTKLISGEWKSEHYTTTTRRLPRKWTDETTASKWLLSHLSEDRVWKRTLISPTQAERLVKSLPSDLIYQPTKIALKKVKKDS